MAINKYSDDITSAYYPIVSKPLSRYDTKLRLKTSGNEVVRFIRKRDLTFNDETSSIHVVTNIEAYRPDIIAYNAYGDETYAWAILSANDMKSFFDLSEGKTIIIPSLASFWGDNGKMVSK